MGEYAALSSLSTNQIDKLRYMRWKCRTDLGYLCRHVLGYKDVSEAVHGPALKFVQQFPWPNKRQYEEHDVLERGRWLYKPIRPIYTLEGPRRRLYLDSRGFLKCLTANNVVRDSSGAMRKVETLRPGDVIWGYDVLSKIGELTRIEGIEKQVPQKTYRITFSSGRVVEASHEHPFLTDQGWAVASQLKDHDRVAVSIPGHHLFGPDFPAAELLGWLLGDGNIIQGKITNTDPKFQQEIIKAANRAGYEAELVEYKNRAPNVIVKDLRPLTRSLGLVSPDGNGKGHFAYRKAATKFIPDIIFRSSRESIREFLYGLFMADGTFHAAGISLTSKSEQLARGAQRLLLMLGIWSQVKTHKVKYEGQELPFWTTHITSQEERQRFVDEIGWKETRLVRLPDCNRHNRRSNNRKYIREGNVVWDLVEKVEDLGEQVTYAVQTENQTICVDDLVTHNTTINCQGHAIQWALNYPEQITILITQAVQDKAESIVGEIKQHFTSNETFRSLFPELCPVKKGADWGTKGQFSTMLRPPGKRESTFTAASIVRGMAGFHYDVLKFTDIVDEENSATEAGIHEVITKFGHMENLVIRPDSWIDVEGTRYSFSDLYGKIIREEMALPKEQRRWKIFVRGCYKKDVSNLGYSEPQYTPEELRSPYARDDKGERVPTWPDRWPAEALEAYRRQHGNILYHLHKENHPIPTDDASMIPFPVNDHFPKEISAKNFRERVRIAYYGICVDTAETVSKRADYTAITVIGWDGFGRPYVVKIIRAKMLGDELIRQLVHLNRQYRPQYIKLEETGYVRGLMHAINRHIQLTGEYLPIRTIKVDNQKSKPERINLTLQPWYKGGDLRFVREWIDCWDALLLELEEFPKGTTDDILDSLADHFQDKRWVGRELAKPSPVAPESQRVAQVMGRYWDRLINEDVGVEMYDRNALPLP